MSNLRFSGVSHGPDSRDFSRVPPPSHVTSVPPPQQIPPNRAPNPDQFHQQQAALQAEQNQDQNKNKKTPYAKPIPKNFQNSWNDIGSGAPPPPLPQNMVGVPPGGGPDGPPPPNFMPPPGCMSLQELQRQATAVVAFGNVYPVLPGSNLFMSIMNGEMAVKDCLKHEFLM